MIKETQLICKAAVTSLSLKYQRQRLFKFQNPAYECRSSGKKEKQKFFQQRWYSRIIFLDPVDVRYLVYNDA